MPITVKTIFEKKHVSNKFKKWLSSHKDVYEKKKQVKIAKKWVKFRRYSSSKIWYFSMVTRIKGRFKNPSYPLISPLPLSPHRVKSALLGKSIAPYVKLFKILLPYKQIIYLVLTHLMTYQPIPTVLVG